MIGRRPYRGDALVGAEVLVGILRHDAARRVPVRHKVQQPHAPARAVVAAAAAAAAAGGTDGLAGLARRPGRLDGAAATTAAATTTTVAAIVHDEDAKGEAAVVDHGDELGRPA